MTERDLRGHDEFVEHYPQLAEQVDELVEGRSWCVTGVSALLRDETSLWFELAKPKHWQMRADGATIIGLGAIGGSLEPNEGLLTCLQREAREEIGTSVEVLPAAETAIVYEQGQVVHQMLEEMIWPGPALLTVSANLYRRRHLPDCAVLAIATFWARPETAPRCGDLYGLLRMPISRARDVLAEPEIVLDRLLALPGVEAQVAYKAPDRAIVHPVWTVRSLQLALQGGLLAL